MLASMMGLGLCAEGEKVLFCLFATLLNSQVYADGNAPEFTRR